MKVKNFIAAALVCISSITYANNSKPRLAVIISVDGLRGNILSELIPSLNEGGIKKLYNNGAYTFAAKSSFLNSGKTAHYASMMTGTTPSNHGITADKFFSLLDKDIINALTDTRYSGINSDETISPKNLIASTITDELKLQNENSKVYSISIDPHSAIMLGGHTADASLWIDDETGMIATSKFYEKGIPNWAAKHNSNNLVLNKANTSWSPSMDLLAYQRKAMTPRSVFTDKIYFHKTDSSHNTYEKITNLKQGPYINDIIQELAVRAIRDEQMGQDNVTDMLCVEFSAKTPYDNYNLCAEIEDVYIRLDQNIKFLLNVIDLSVGLDNAIIVFTGYQSESYSHELLKSKRINSGTFNAKRSMALLNAYLMAIYGQGQWVSGYYARNIHLNRALIEENKIKMSEIQEYTAQFMLEFSGVHTAIFAHQLQYLSMSNDDYVSRTKRSHFKNRSGDVIFNLLPGWYEVNDNNEYVGLTSRKQNNNPIFIMGYEIKNKNIDINIEDIIPTICNEINTPLPNACTGDKIILK